MTDEYLSPERIDTLFTGIAVGSGRTRAAFDAEMDALGNEAGVADHLTLMEAEDLDGLDPDRLQHLDGCGYCRRLVDTIYRPIDVTAFDRKLEDELAAAARPVGRRQFALAAMMLIGIVLGVVGTQTIGATVGAEPSHGMWIILSDDKSNSLNVVKEKYFANEIPYGSIIYREARRNGLPPELVAAMVEANSDFRPRLVSNRNAQGLMQIIPETSRLLDVHDAFDPEDNVAAGTRYLRYLLDRFGGDAEVALAAYNGGEGVVTRFGGVPQFEKDYVQQVKRETQNYRQRVRAAYIAALRVDALR